MGVGWKHLVCLGFKNMSEVQNLRLCLSQCPPEENPSKSDTLKFRKYFINQTSHLWPLRTVKLPAPCMLSSVSHYNLNRVPPQGATSQLKLKTSMSHTVSMKGFSCVLALFCPWQHDPPSTHTHKQNVTQSDAVFLSPVLDFPISFGRTLVFLNILSR